MNQLSAVLGTPEPIPWAPEANDSVACWTFPLDSEVQNAEQMPANQINYLVSDVPAALSNASSICQREPFIQLDNQKVGVKAAVLSAPFIQFPRSFYHSMSSSSIPLFPGFMTSIPLFQGS